LKENLSVKARGGNHHPDIGSHGAGKHRDGGGTSKPMEVKPATKAASII